MAYVDFSDTLSAPVSTPVQAAAKQEQRLFTGLEWLVIGLARRERLSSLAEPGRLSRAVRSLFGLSTSSGLADSRLERLRRMAIFVWHRGWRLPESEVAEFLREFSTDQLEALVASVSRQTASVGRRLAA